MLCRASPNLRSTGKRNQTLPGSLPSASTGQLGQNIGGLQGLSNDGTTSLEIDHGRECNRYFSYHLNEFINMIWCRMHKVITCFGVIFIEKHQLARGFSQLELRLLQHRRSPKTQLLVAVTMKIERFAFFSLFSCKLRLNSTSICDS